MKKVIFLLFVFIFISQLVFAQRPSGVVYKTSTAPTIDGEIDEVWTTAVQYNIDRKFMTDEPTLGASGTTYWKALWDDQGMYILCVVNDDAWYPTWMAGMIFADYVYDNAELYFDTNTILEDRVGGQMGNTGHTQIAAKPIKDKVDGTMLSWNVRNFMVKYAYKVTGSAYKVEYFVPWECIPDKNGDKFDRSNVMGFDVNIVDADPVGEVRRRAVWANQGAKDENWNNMDDAGHLVFRNMVDIEVVNSRTFVPGELVQLFAKTNYPNPETLTYSWSPSEGLSQTNIPNPIVTTQSDKTYTLTVTTSDGNTDKADVFIKVNPFVATSQNQTVSCGNTVQLDVSTNYSGSEPLTYNWTPKDNLDDPTSKNPIATLTKPTDFTVEVTTSNGTKATTNMHVNLSKTDFLPELCVVSVDSGNKNILAWKSSFDTAIQDYLIFRESLIQTDFYDLIGSVASSGETLFTDPTSNALVQSNKYKIAARDKCGFVTGLSAAHKTMHLSVTKGQRNAWNLIWEPYEGFPVSSYKIYRGTSPKNLSLIGSTAGSANSYTDFNAPEADVCYQIEILTPSSCNTLKSAALYSSRSNTVSITYNSVPAELTKEGLNIFPVPVKDKLYLNKNLDCITEMVILSVDGRIELSFKKPVSGECIDVSNLSKGIHFLKLADEEGISVQKFIKE